MMLGSVYSTEYTIPWSGPNVPKDKTIQVGDTLIFEPTDGQNHTVTSSDTPMLFDSGEIGNPSHPTFVYVFNQAGTYHFFCKLHNDNAFVLTVIDNAPASSEPATTGSTAPATSTETTAPTSSTETTAPTASGSQAASGSHAASGSTAPTKAPGASSESITQPPKTTIPPAAEEHQSSEHSSATFTKFNPILLVAFIVLSVFMF